MEGFSLADKLLASEEGFYVMKSVFVLYSCHHTYGADFVTLMLKVRE